MEAVGCEFRSRFTGYESQALSPAFLLVPAGGQGDFLERRALSGALRGARFAPRSFGRCGACEGRVLKALGLVCAGLVRTLLVSLELSRFEAGGVVDARQG
jgi:hypothetical protein